MLCLIIMSLTRALAITFTRVLAITMTCYHFKRNVFRVSGVFGMWTTTKLVHLTFSCLVFFW